MEPDKGKVVKKPSGVLLPYDEEELQAASDYACERKEKLEELTDKFGKMGKLGLFWDSKVPEKDKSFYYFFTFRSSKKEDVIAEIEKYLQFYKEMSEIAKDIGDVGGDDESDGDKTSQETKDAYTLVLDLRDHLAKLSRAAEAGEKTTGSSAVYDLHWEFVAKHERLKSLIKRVECVALKKSWQKSLEAIDRLQADLKKSDDRHKDVCDKFDRLFEKHVEARTEKKELQRENDLLQRQQVQLLQARGSGEEELRELRRENEELQREKGELSEAVRDLRQQQKELFDKNTVMLSVLQTIADEMAKK